MKTAGEMTAKQKAEFHRLACEAVIAANALSCFLTNLGDSRMYLANQALRPLWRIQDGSAYTETEEK